MLVLAGFMAAVAELAGYQQNTGVVTSARLTLVNEATTDLIFTVTNLRNSPLQHISVQFRTERGTQTSFWNRGIEGSPTIPPSAADDLRLEDLAGRLDDTSPPVVVLLEFADGYYEGTDSELRPFFKERAERADDLRYWVGALSAMPAGLSNADATNYIQNAANEQLARQPGKSSATASHLLQLGQTRRPRDWIAQVLTTEVKELDEELKHVTRHLDRLAKVGTSGVMAAGLSATLTVRTAPGVRTVPVLENLRDLPLQAWSILFKESEQASSGFSTDTCSGRTGTASDSAIGPRETRRLVEGRHTTSQQSSSLSAELRLAVFSDGVAEGAPEEVRRILERRKDRGLDCTR